jgi:hypothetical protein
MSYYDTTWYCNAGDQSTTGYYAVAKWAATTAIAAGALRRQLAAPAVNSERVFVCIVAGTTGSTEPTWVLTRGAKTTDGTVTWMECTGVAAVNGDVTNTVNWTAAKAIGTPTLGTIIKRANAASYWICTTAGTMGASEPSWPNDTAGTTQADGTTTWTCMGVVGNFTGGQAPHARLFTACAPNWFAAFNTIYVGDNHAESQTTTLSLNPAAGLSNQIGRIICHDHLGPYPPGSGNLKNTATISTTANAAINIFFSSAGAFYVYGLTFKAVVGTTGNSNIVIGFDSSGQNWSYFDNCSFWLASTSGSSAIQIIGQAVFAGTVFFNNTSVKFASTGQSINIFGAVFVWQNTAPALVSGSTVPNFLLSGDNFVMNILLEALDLSLFSGTLFRSTGGVNNPYGTVVVKDCKLNASVTPYSSALANSGMTAQFVRSDSGATAYKSARYQYEGTETTETSITRVGGAADPTGQAQSRKLVTTANSQWLMPFKVEPYAIWNPTTGANVTVTVYGTINAGALPNNDDIWLEVEYLGSSASPLGTIVTTTKSNVLAANAAVASDGSTWNGGGSGAGWSPFKLTTTLAAPQPGMAGYLHARVRAAKPSTTYYIDPKIVLS